ncbi:MAG: hypothetical protein AABX66_00095 [Nanoarchaeota archaeon]
MGLLNVRIFDSPIYQTELVKRDSEDIYQIGRLEMVSQGEERILTDSYDNFPLWLSVNSFPYHHKSRTMGEKVGGEIHQNGELFKIVHFSERTGSGKVVFGGFGWVGGYQRRVIVMDTEGKNSFPLLLEQELRQQNYRNNSNDLLLKEIIHSLFHPPTT